MCHLLRLILQTFECCFCGRQTITTTTTTATRSAGSYITDGFRVGDFVTFDGSHETIILLCLKRLTATVLTTSGLTANTGGGDERCLLAGENLTASEFGLKTIPSVEICSQEDIKTRFVVGILLLMVNPSVYTV